MGEDLGVFGLTLTEADFMAVFSPHARAAEMADIQGDGRIPPLENGDRLTRAEFERRYTAMPGVKKAELIEGVVYMPSPVRYNAHGNPHSQMMTWLGFYAVNTTGVGSCDNGSIRLDLDNEPQPDAFLIIASECGGQCEISADDYVEGAPELVAEVSSSSVSYDLGDKLKVFRRNGVREYVVWRVLDRKIDWYVLKNDQFEANLPGADGILRSMVYPGLWLDPAALLRGDLPAVFGALQRGLESDEHRKFVQRLEQARSR
jgi:Uma2 family endonuclease